MDSANNVVRSVLHVRGNAEHTEKYTEEYLCEASNFAGITNRIIKIIGMTYISTIGWNMILINVLI